MTELHKAVAIKLVKNILKAMHEKRYADISNDVDESKWKDMNEL